MPKKRQPVQEPSLQEKMEANRKKLQELEQEKRDLEAELLRQKTEERQAWVNRLSEALNRNVLLLDVLAPAHAWRCTDGFRANGTQHGNADDGYCVRCLLLDVQTENILPEHYTLKLVVERD